MKFLSNLHTHTKYCDGKNTPEEIILKAIELKFSSIGFSGHSYTRENDSCCMTEQGTDEYISEIKFLKKRYKNRIEVVLGIEEDFYSDTSVYRNEFEYIIGAVHDLYSPKTGEYYPVDYKIETFEKALNELSGGDIQDFIRCYYFTLEQMLEKQQPQIVAHYDLIKKLNFENRYFNENDDWYREIALKPLIKIKELNSILEINTGAAARGYNVLYPSKFILEAACKTGIPITINSDAHDKNFLNFGFDLAVNLAISSGYLSIKQYKDGKFADFEI